MSVKMFNEFNGSEDFADDFSKDGMISKIMKYNSKYKKEDLDKLSFDEVVAVLDKELDRHLADDMDINDMENFDESYASNIEDVVETENEEDYNTVLDAAQSWIADRNEHTEPLTYKEKRKIQEFAIYLERYYKVEKKK